MFFAVVARVFSAVVRPRRRHGGGCWPTPLHARPRRPGTILYTCTIRTHNGASSLHIIYSVPSDRPSEWSGQRGGRRNTGIAGGGGRRNTGIAGGGGARFVLTNGSCGLVNDIIIAILYHIKIVHGGIHVIVFASRHFHRSAKVFGYLSLTPNTIYLLRKHSFISTASYDFWQSSPSSFYQTRIVDNGWVYTSTLPLIHS